MKQSQAGINAYNLLSNSVIYRFSLGFSLLQPISDCVSCLVIHKIWWYKIITIINIFVQLILKTLLKSPFLQACETTNLYCLFP